MFNMDVREAIDFIDSETIGYCLPIDISSFLDNITINKKYFLFFNKKQRVPIRLFYVDNLDCICKSYKEDNCYRFIIKKDLVSIKNRFAIAHCIGHMLLGHLENEDVVETDYNFKFQSSTSLDIDANKVASNLLLPKSFLNAAVSNRYNVTKMASIFDISTFAVRMRLKEDGYI